VKERLDRRIRALHPDLSWTRIRQAVARGQVLINGAVERDPGALVAASDAIDLDVDRPATRHVRLDLPRLYEDDEILVVDKPAGLLTIASRPEARATEDTVLRRVQAYVALLHGRDAYAGILHRLDRDTSGALALAFTREVHAAGRALFAAHAFERWYLAIVHGVPPQQSVIRAPISDAYVSGRRRIVHSTDEGRDAVTHYVVREQFGDTALLELRLETGRQHQIRLHLELIGHPLVGERVYTRSGATGAAGPSGAAGAAVGAARPMLHAWRLEFPHPLRGHPIRAEAPLPADFLRVLRRLRHG
jgi:23S rRNA pseudouridine1911/1915/1917 synthase